MSERLEKALLYTLRNEDRTLSGKVYETPGDSGKRTRYGLAEISHPELVKSGFYDDMPQNLAYEAAVSTYNLDYWTPIEGDYIISEQVAIKLFDHCVNMGIHPSVYLMQKCLNSMGEVLMVDGRMGQNTLAAINRQMPSDLLLAYCQALKERYNEIVIANPGDAKFLKGWVARAEELPNA